MRSFPFLLLFMVMLHSLWITNIDCLKCRKDNSAQEAHFKRVIRSCMRKIGETSNRKGEMYASINSRNDNYQGNNNNNRYKFSRNFNNSDNNSRNRYNQRDNYYSQTEEQYQERNKYSNGNEYSARYGNTKNTQSNNKYNQQQQQQQSDYDRYGIYGDDDDGGQYGEQRKSQNIFNIMSSNVRGDQSNDSACVVHCFFSELNMLNDDSFPDRNQVNYILMHGARDRELRAFYTDTVQKCFRFVDSKHHRDRCEYARDIAQCLMEYAKANCEDIQTHSIIFN